MMIASATGPSSLQAQLPSVSRHGGCFAVNPKHSYPCQPTNLNLSAVPRHVTRINSFCCTSLGKRVISPYAGGMNRLYIDRHCMVTCASSSGADNDALPEDSNNSEAVITQQTEFQLESTEPESLPYKHVNSGRCGMVSFYSSWPGQTKAAPGIQHISEAWTSVLWILGPAALVASVVLPPFLVRKVFEAFLEDSLITDFVILFFTEVLFYAGASIFLMVIHKVQNATGVVNWNSGSRLSLGYKLSSYATMVLSVLLPVGAFAIVWPWTGPVAAAALFPYVAGLAVQYGFEHIVQERKSPVWPAIPIVFQVYRLHQLNRATQLVAGLLYSLKGAEATAETLAVNGSLSTLVTVLQLLGMLCIWSLASYLTHVFSSEAQDWQSRVTP